jgi:hypothetical protein
MFDDVDEIVYTCREPSEHNPRAGREVGLIPVLRTVPNRAEVQPGCGFWTAAQQKSERLAELDRMLARKGFSE